MNGQPITETTRGRDGNEANNRKSSADPIVVGVDRSPTAETALRFAIDEAKRRGAPLRVVHAWRLGDADSKGAAPACGAQPDESRRAAKVILDKTLRNIAGNAHHVQIQPVLVEGASTDVLVNESRHAQLLVVGSRRLGTLRSLLLGSVSRQCANRATCPTTIVPRTTPRTFSTSVDSRRLDA